MVVSSRKKSAEAPEAADADVAAEPVPPAPAEAKPDAVAELRARLEETERRAQDLFTKLQYAQAGAENARKRAEREIGEVARYANERIVLALLPVLDAFDAAVGSADPEARKGIAMVRDALAKVLREAGVEEVPTTGTFDPYVHEAVDRVSDEALEDGAIKDVVQKGYRLDMRLLRPAKVIVVRKGGEP